MAMSQVWIHAFIFLMFSPKFHLPANAQTHDVQPNKGLRFSDKPV